MKRPQKLTLEISLENAAFDDDKEGSLLDEIRAVLDQVVIRLAVDGYPTPSGGLALRDTNGNTIGFVCLR